jgi:hypothetical protein
MKKTILIVIVVLSLLGCDRTKQRSFEAGDGFVVAFRPSQETLGLVRDNIGYIKKDGRCYAVLFTASYGSFVTASITHIPCD